MRRSTGATLVILVILVIAAVVVVSDWSNNKTNNDTNGTTNTTSTPNPTPQNPPAGNPPASDSGQTPVAGTIYIKNKIFAPSQINVQKGSAVTWVNNDDIAHTVTIDHGDGPTSGNIAAGASYSYTFNTAGSFQYHCEIHPSMRGTIVVQ
jgi:plastocyanin